MTTRAVVVGSGPNGLAAAIRMAEAGWEVTVLERAQRAGGAVATEELTLPGFRHDTYSSVYPAGAASPVFARMPLHEHGLRWVHPEACVAHVVEGDRAVALYRDLQRTAESLDAQHPGDGRRWVQFAHPLVEASDDLRATMLSGFPPLAGPLRMVASMGVAGALGFGRLLPERAQRFAGRVFEGGDGRAWLYGIAAHGSATPFEPGSAVVAAYLSLLGHVVGWPSPEGGAGRLAAALVGYLEQLGGEVRLGESAQRVAAERGRVVGIELDGGERVPCDVVVADVLPQAVVGMAGAALPSRYVRGLRRYRIGPSTLKVDWALDGQIPWAAAEAREAGTVHVGGPDGEMLGAIAESKLRVSRQPFLLVGQQSIADPSRAPGGRHTAWAYMHGPHDADWTGRRHQVVEDIHRQVERFAPGFGERVLATHVAGPGDLERRNANLVHGDVGGGAYDARQILFRPVVAASPYRTPLAGLYLGSAATFPGGGVHGVCGDAAARAAIADRRGVPGRAAGKLLRHAVLT